MKMTGVLPNIDVGVPRAADPVSVRGGNGKKPASAPPEPGPAASSDGAKELEHVAAEINRFLENHRSVVDFSIDPELQQIITKVIDRSTGEVLLQYPPEALVDVMKRMRDLRGLLLHKEG